MKLFEYKAYDHSGGKVEAQLEEARSQIVKDLVASQGPAVDLSGYYHPDPTKVEKVMRPSQALNSIIDGIA